MGNFGVFETRVKAYREARAVAEHRKLMGLHRKDELDRMYPEAPKNLDDVRLAATRMGFAVEEKEGRIYFTAQLPNEAYNLPQGKEWDATTWHDSISKISNMIHSLNYVLDWDHDHFGSIEEPNAKYPEIKNLKATVFIYRKRDPVKDKNIP